MISIKNVSKKFSTADGEFQAVSSVSLEINKGEVYGIIGFSGAGKSTLLRMINLLERPDTGSVFVDGVDLTKLSKKELLKQRLSMGMIFQHFNLLSNRTVSENVSFSLEIAGVPKAERKKRVNECLEIVGLADKANAYPAKLSGGQKQRVAIARALATQPSVLLCDEPTSALDPQTTESILKFLKEISGKLGITIIIVTHEMEVIKSICNKVSVMENGKVVETINLADSQFNPISNIAQFLFKKELELQREEGIVNVR
jgi:D-methionine transport system ATP-binding protein